MSAATADGQGHEEDLIAEIFRDFRDGLPVRIETMRSALEQLAQGFDPQAAEVFYRTAHSLKGTAPSFEAHELSERVAELADVGLRWHEDGAFDAAEVPAAREGLERVREAAMRYTAEMEGDSSG